jgi:hypothetical protein
MNAAFPIRNHILHPDGWGVKLAPEEVPPASLELSPKGLTRLRKSTLLRCALELLRVLGLSVSGPRQHAE